MIENDNNEFEEDEVLVYMDFGSEILSSELDNPNLDVKIIGIDTDSPIAELNGKLLKGTYEFSIGTHIFFEKDNDPPPLDPLYEINPQEMYKYLTKTTKVLKMKRLFVKSKNIESDQKRDESLEDIRSRLEVNMNYGEALNLLLPPGVRPPRRISVNDNTIDHANESELEDNENDDNDPDFVPDSG